MKALRCEDVVFFIGLDRPVEWIFSSRMKTSEQVTNARIIMNDLI
ncbi:MAG: hypothetical protein R6V01_05745 [Thermoplasmatota archaeon]